MPSYAVKEIFYSLQGEGARAGRAAVFCRFAGCNLWSGREADRAGAACRFCDTDFVGVDGIGGGRFATPDSLAEEIAGYWPAAAAGDRYVVFTGGEPLLQLDAPLVAAMRARRFEVAVETNGTVAPSCDVDWLCVSPKAGTALVVTEGDELKLVHPQPGLDPETFLGLRFRSFFLQPMDGPEQAANMRATLEYCLQHPRWRLSIQTHKVLGIR